MQVNNAMIGYESGCPQGNPVWSEKVYTPISNKPPLGKPFTLQHLLLQHLLFDDFTIEFFLLFYNVVLQVRRAASINIRQACEYRFTE
jgi:hypothetical protein